MTSLAVAMPGRVVSQAASEGDISLCTFVQQLFQHAREHRRPLVQTWNNNYLALHCRDYYRGQVNESYAIPKLPEMWPIVAAMVGWMTDTRPGFEVAPVAEPFSQFTSYYNTLAQDLQTVLHANWIVNDADAEIEKMLWDANVYGTGILKTLWDANLVGGLGDAVMRRVDPFTFFVDPNATDLTNSNFFVEVRQMTYTEIERTFPNKVDSVYASGFQRADPSPNRLDAGAISSPGLNLGNISPNTNTQWGITNDRKRSRSPYDKVTVFECWIRESKRMTRTSKREDGMDEIIPYIFDGWRCVICTDSVVLLDKYAQEMFPHGQHPYSRFVLQETGEFWGQSLVEFLAPIQQSINWIASYTERHLWLTGNPIMVYDVQSGLANKAVTNAAGQQFKINNGGNVNWLTPPQMDANLAAQLIQFYKSEMETVSGLSAIVRGFMPSGRNAQGVLEQVQESAFVRVRLALRNLERTLRHAGDKMASIVVEFYDSPRSVSLVGPSGEKTFLALKSQHFSLPGDDGRVPLKYQLLTGAGSMLPTARQARANQMFQLYALGIVDEEAVLEILQIPNWQTIVARVREMKAAAGTLGQPPGARQKAARQQA